MGFAETFKALSDPVRRDILEMLKKGRMSAGDIGSHFEMTGATISYHLNILKKAELVRETKQKNFVFYENAGRNPQRVQRQSAAACRRCDAERAPQAGAGAPGMPHEHHPSAQPV